MAFFTSEGIRIAYEVYGEGAPVVLVHGFASNGEVNWVSTGWVEALNTAGYKAITLDNRGHGQSEKLYDPEVYPARLMAHDVANLIDHLELGPVALMGYSMGTRISAYVALDAPGKVACAIWGGLGINIARGMNDSDEIIAALRAERLEDVAQGPGRRFRLFADRTGSDREALAACMASSRDRISEADLQRISQPVLVAVGSDDDIAGSPEELVALLREGELLVIERRDHMRATGDPQFKKGAIAFLQRHFPSSMI